MRPVLTLAFTTPPGVSGRLSASNLATLPAFATANKGSSKLKPMSPRPE